MILTGSEIIIAQQTNHINIEPFDPSQVNPNSYNVRLGSTLLTYDSNVLDPYKNNSTTEHIIPLEGYVLEPGELYLGHTVESVGSTQYVPMLFGRSSVGRLGLFVEITAPIGDVGFFGQWTLQLTPVRHIKIYSNIMIAQVMFFKTTGVIKQYDGKYQGAKGPQSSGYWKNKDQ